MRSTAERSAASAGCGRPPSARAATLPRPSASRRPPRTLPSYAMTPSACSFSRRHHTCAVSSAATDQKMSWRGGTGMGGTRGCVMQGGRTGWDGARALRAVRGRGRARGSGLRPTRRTRLRVDEQQAGLGQVQVVKVPQQHLPRARGRVERMKWAATTVSARHRKCPVAPERPAPSALAPHRKEARPDGAAPVADDPVQQRPRHRAERGRGRAEDDVLALRRVVDLRRVWGSAARTAR